MAVKRNQPPTTHTLKWNHLDHFVSKYKVQGPNPVTVISKLYSLPNSPKQSHGGGGGAGQGK